MKTGTPKHRPPTTETPKHRNSETPKHRNSAEFSLRFVLQNLMLIGAMINVLETSLDPVSRSLNPEAARKLLELKAAPALQERIDALADRCSEGVASDEELSEYDSMIHAANLIAILQAEARRVLFPGQP